MNNKFTPVKTRGSTKATKSNSHISEALSNHSTPVLKNDASSVLSAVETALSNIEVIGRIAELVAVKVADSVGKQITDSLQVVLRDVADLKSHYDALKEKVSKMEDKNMQRLDELEQYQRRNNLRVFGINENANEDTDNLLIDLFKSKLDVQITKQDIDRSHRVGSHRRTGEEGTPRPRPIIIKFVSYRTRREVFTNKKKLKGTGVIIKEDLTSHRLDLLRRTMELHGVKNVWTVDGRIKWVTADMTKGQATW